MTDIGGPLHNCAATKTELWYLVTAYVNRSVDHLSVHFSALRKESGNQAFLSATRGDSQLPTNRRCVIVHPISVTT